MEIEKNHFLLFSSIGQSVLFISYLNNVFKSDQFVIFKLLTKHVVHIFSYVPIALRNLMIKLSLSWATKNVIFFVTCNGGYQARLSSIAHRSCTFLLWEIFFKLFQLFW